MDPFEQKLIAQGLTDLLADYRKILKDREDSMWEQRIQAHRRMNAGLLQRENYTNGTGCRVKNPWEV